MQLKRLFSKGKKKNVCPSGETGIILSRCKCPVNKLRIAQFLVGPRAGLLSSPWVRCSVGAIFLSPRPSERWRSFPGVGLPSTPSHFRRKADVDEKRTRISIFSTWTDRGRGGVLRGVGRGGGLAQQELESLWLFRTCPVHSWRIFHLYISHITNTHIYIYIYKRNV